MAYNLPLIKVKDLGIDMSITNGNTVNKTKERQE